jgi:hypothetical protein
MGFSEPNKQETINRVAANSIKTKDEQSPNTAFTHQSIELATLRTFMDFDSSTHSIIFKLEIWLDLVLLKVSSKRISLRLDSLGFPLIGG